MGTPMDTSVPTTYTNNSGVTWNGAYTFNLRGDFLLPGGTTSATRVTPIDKYNTVNFTPPSSGDVTTITTEIDVSSYCGSLFSAAKAKVSFQLWKGRIMVPNTLKLLQVIPNTASKCPSSVIEANILQGSNIIVTQPIKLKFYVACTNNGVNYNVNGNYTISYPSNRSTEGDYRLPARATSGIVASPIANSPSTSEIPISTTSAFNTYINSKYQLRLMEYPPELSSCIINGNSYVNYY